MAMTTVSSARRLAMRGSRSAKRLMVVASTLVLFATPARAAAVQLEEIDSELSTTSASFTIRLSGPTTYMARSLAAEGERQDRIYLDLYDTEIGAAARKWALSIGPVRQVRSGQFKPGLTRVVLDLKRPLPYRVEARENPYRLLLRVGDRTVRGSGRASRPPTTSRGGKRVKHPEAPPARSLPARNAGPLLVTARDRDRLREVAAARQAGSPGEDYVIGPDDLLEIRIPDLSEDQALPSRLKWAAPGPSPIAAAPAYHHGVRVSGSGEVTLPVLGPVPAAGHTPRELERSIARLLITRGILRRPDVSVFVVEYRSRFVSVVGEVERPGSYPLTGRGATVSDMIWAAGGPSREAGRIIEFAPARNGSSANGSGGRASERDPIRIDFETLMQHRGDRSSDPAAWPGDVVNVAPAGSVNVDGWVSRPGAYGVTRGLTLAGAIAAAGGPQFPARLQDVEILRTIGRGQQRRFRVDVAAIRDGKASDMPVQDGDVIRVPASALRIVPWSFWTAARSIFHVGGSLLLF